LDTLEDDDSFEENND